MSELKKLFSGKVRDIYEVDDKRLMIITSDRISAFDVVMGELIPDKGRVLTALTAWWANKLLDLAPNHLISADITEFKELTDSFDLAYLEGRTMLVKKAQMLPVELIVRGYISGSAWKEYQQSGTVHKEKVLPNLLQSAKFPEPIFSPSTKAETGHDVNLSYSETVDILGTDLTNKLKDICLNAYQRAHDLLIEKGIILADTKFEMGYIDGEIAFCDEIITPDSSRFWPVDKWKPGETPPSFDKQPLRDWLEASGWDKNPPPPALPKEVVEKTSSLYKEAYRLVTGKALGL